MTDWISVAKELPPIDDAEHLGGSDFSKEVLVITEEGHITIARHMYPWRNKNCFKFVCFHDKDIEEDYKMDSRITHWTKISKPEGIDYE